MIFIPSALGRPVAITDRSSQYDDRILKILFDFQSGSLELMQPFLAVEELSVFSRLSEEDLRERLESLERHGLVERDDSVSFLSTGFRISRQGVALVQQAQHAA